MDNEKVPQVVLIDDLRSFVDGRPADVARTSVAGIELLQRRRAHRLDELWLDHDLGGEDTVWPVIELLERAASEGASFDIGTVYVHSSNPPGARRIVQSLGRLGYDVRLVSGSPHVGYLVE